MKKNFKKIMAAGLCSAALLSVISISSTAANALVNEENIEAAQESKERTRYKGNKMIYIPEIERELYGDDFEYDYDFNSEEEIACFYSRYKGIIV